MKKPNNRLKNALKCLHVTQKELAEGCDTTEVSVNRYVNGKRTPNVIMAMKIARYLQLNVYDLWSTKDE